jgi:alcohol dehydrogenase
MPRTNLIGVGALKDLSVQLLDYKLSKVMIVTDTNIINYGYVDMIEKILKSLFISYEVFSGVKHPNCTTSFVEDGLDFMYKGFKLRDYAFIISIGGGTNHDCAKAMAAVASNGGVIGDYEGYDKLLKPSIKHIAINTTAGSASELTAASIVIDHTKRTKMTIMSPKIVPDISVNDPLLMQTMPKEVTASSGYDALSHAIEAYVATEASPITDALALGALNIAYHYLPRVFENGNDLEAREKMMYANVMAGIAFGNGGLGYVHAMSHQLGGFYKENAHGCYNAILLPLVLEYNSDTIPDERILKIAEAMDIQTNDKLRAIEQITEQLRKLSIDIGIEGDLTQMGVQEADIETLSQNALKDVCALTNPKQGTVDEIAGIFKRAM